MTTAQTPRPGDTVEYRRGKFSPMADNGTGVVEGITNLDGDTFAILRKADGSSVRVSLGRIVSVGR